MEPVNEYWHLSVGYCVNSKRGTQFRIWATYTPPDHLLRGYTLNEYRFAERGLDALHVHHERPSASPTSISAPAATYQRIVISICAGYSFGFFPNPGFRPQFGDPAADRVWRGMVRTWR